MIQGKLKIAVIAPPWLKLYPGCYYGIENVVHYLTSGLTKQGHHVELFTVKGSTTKVTKRHWYHAEPQYKYIHRPWYEVLSLSISHILYALNIIRDQGDFDIIHDHNSFLGPALMAYANAGLPPILHTLHEPFSDRRLLARGIPDNRLMFEQFTSLKRLYFNTVSESQLQFAPKKLRSHIKGVVYNGVDPDDYLFSSNKRDYFLIVARISPDKGQGTAAKLCSELGEKLKIAGNIGAEISTPAQLKRELEDPKKNIQVGVDLKYFQKYVQPYIEPNQISYIGTISGEKKKKTFSQAKAFLFPIDWEEPFGMAAIDALASGTPVVAYKRGALPEIIEHGVNGFLADNYRQFKYFVKRVGDINPEACRNSVINKFSTDVLTKNYLNLYRRLIKETNK